MLPLLCPLCKTPLIPDGGVYHCRNRHSYDRSHYGYTNLLSPKGAGQHGDNREMILSRRAFLEGGWYQPLRDAICRAAVGAVPEGGIVLDAGCGEGYYTDALIAALSGQGVRGIGVDISREALREAGKRPTARDGTLSLFVAGVYDMPVADHSVDLVLNVFAPLAADEYRRVLKPGGCLLMAIPDARHLWELKSVLYDTPYENRVQDTALPGFSPADVTPLTTRFTLPTQQAIRSLFAMTPYYYRTPEAGRARLAALSSLTVTASFLLLSYRIPTV